MIINCALSIILVINNNISVSIDKVGSGDRCYGKM